VFWLPTLLRSDDGRSASFTSFGGLRRLEIDGLSLLLYPASELESGLAGIWLRLLDGAAAVPLPLLDPATEASSYVDGESYRRAGVWRDLEWQTSFSFPADGPSWRWQISVRNRGTEAVRMDTVHAADIALAPYSAVRCNEYFVSQYLDITPLSTSTHGTCLAVRQNMPGPRVPWVLLGSATGAAGWATDALQLSGCPGEPALTGLRSATLPNARLQHEHTLATLASEPVLLEPGETWDGGYFGCFVADHPAASFAADAALTGLAGAVIPLDAPTTDPLEPSPRNLFAAAPVASVVELSTDELARLADGPIEVTESCDGRWWEAVAEDGTVWVSAAKETAVLRPHGQILRTGHSLSPDSAALTVTVWMSGTFASQLTQGHAGRTPMLSAARTYLGAQPAHGLRCFVRLDERWHLLGRPSAWGLTPHGARWLYALPGELLEIAVEAPTTEHRLTVEVRRTGSAGAPVLLAAQLATGGDDGQGSDGPELTFEPGRVIGRTGAGSFTVEHSGVAAGDAGGLFEDGGGPELPWLTFRGGSGSVSLAFTADLTGPADRVAPAVEAPDRLWADLRDRLRLTGTGELASEVADLNRALPWFAHDALVHYLSPRGLEQYTGGAWGTRDVCQGPASLLLTLDRPDAFRELLVTVFAAQNERGDWPQAFEFLPPLPPPVQAGSHGDVVFWPLLAAGEYLAASRDGTVLDEAVPFVGDGVRTAPAPLSEHLERAFAAVVAATLPGSPLPRYGHGDWNDSLQPADPDLAARLVSSWTSILQVQALRTLGSGLRMVGRCAVLARRVLALAEATAAALGRDLSADGLLAGYGLFGEGGDPELLVHPRDRRTGLSYGVLPWIHAISADLLSPEEARTHLEAIRRHLLGPDGARLFDRPAPYRGGPMRTFQRAEAATFWGREIGLMYTHAHLRYAEALARVGHGPELLEALGRAHPVGLARRCPQARPRQSTCYYSSSDAVFADRADAAERYPQLLRGEVDVEGGWRVYSSGPGLFLRLVTETFLGLRRRGMHLEVDPVLDPRLDGLSATVPLGAGALQVEYRVGPRGHGVVAVHADGHELRTMPLTNPYRPPGVRVLVDQLPGSRLVVEVG